jgi:hypothetical protein
MEGRPYVVSTTNMGKYTADPNLTCNGSAEENRTDVDKVQQELPPGTVGSDFSTPAFWNGPSGQQYGYFTSVNGRPGPSPGVTGSSRPPPPPRQQMATAALRSCPATEPRRARVSSGKSITVRNCTPITQAIWRTSFTTLTRMHALRHGRQSLSRCAWPAAWEAPAPPRPRLLAARCHGMPALPRRLAR